MVTHDTLTADYEALESRHRTGSWTRKVSNGFHGVASFPPTALS